MGDHADASDLNYFARSAEGKEYLQEIYDMLHGRTIIDITFSNESSYIATTLHLDDGTTFFIRQPSLEVDAVREEYGEAMERACCAKARGKSPLQPGQYF